MNDQPTVNPAAPRLMLVDDCRATVAATGTLLRREGYDVVPAYSVREALDLLDAAPVDIVVSDIRLPDVDGFDFLRVLRHRFPGLPIILSTGQPITADDVVPRSARILRKPYDLHELKASIAGQLAAARGSS